MISNVFLVQLQFEKPADYCYGRQQRLWSDQKKLALALFLNGFEVKTNSHGRSYCERNEAISFYTPSQEHAQLAEKLFVQMMRNRGYTIKKA